MIRNFKAYWPLVKLVVLIVIPIILLILPADFFNDGQAVCLSVLLAGVECYACGLTRGMMHLIHFDFAEAYYFNPLSFVVFPLLAWVWGRWLWQAWRKVQHNRKLHLDHAGRDQ